jgi:TonB family protein
MRTKFCAVRITSCSLVWLAAVLVAVAQTPNTSRSDTALPGPNEFVMVDREARPRNLAQLKQCVYYPDSAKQAGVQGKVILRVLVNEHGSYVRHLVARTPHPWLTEPAELCVPILQFEPATFRGKPVPMWVNVPLNFTLNESSPATPDSITTPPAPRY